MSVAPEFVRIAKSAGLFVNAANAYLSAFALHEPGGILVVRGLLPSFPDTGAGESVVGDFDVRSLSITTNAARAPPRSHARLRPRSSSPTHSPGSPRAGRGLPGSRHCAGIDIV